ncbi:uncharacterized protein LOC117647343, partial [Thrips palmi]|uniref:Uncharacterized protein LOC117647343 n=1 Tax=Thrips palmi TaxID=161013 RepID=A0A6P8YXU5_THRPL
PADEAPEWDPGPREDDDVDDDYEDGELVGPLDEPAVAADRRQGDAADKVESLSGPAVGQPTVGQPTVGPTEAGTDAVSEQPDEAQGRTADDDRLEDSVPEEVQHRSSFAVHQDSLAAESEALPMAAPLSMGGRGPPMTLSLEDMDYLTILRPPAQTGKGKVVAASTINKTRQRPPQTPPQTPGGPPMGPMPQAPSSYDPYNSYSSPYDPPHPYGYGYGYNGYDYPHYPDPVMSHEYQQATSYPEEERFRPMGSGIRHPGPAMLPSLASPMTSPMTSPMASQPASQPASPLSPLTSPMAASTASTASAGYDSYSPGYHNHRDYPLPLLGLHRGARHAGHRCNTVVLLQVSQSVSLGEHDPSNWISTAVPSAANAEATKKATLKDILAQDCPGAEELGYCDSPPRYPMQQVAEAIQRCSQLLEHMFAPPPEERDADTKEAEGEGACQSVRRTLRPGYVRDASSGRWLVSLQSRGRVVQKVAVERCSAPGRPCARLSDSKCARNLGFRNGARPTSCDQRHTLMPVLTWDPETPATCPRVRLARFPTACVCRVGS